MSGLTYRRHRLPRLYTVMGVRVTGRELVTVVAQAVGLVVGAVAIVAYVMVLTAVLR